MSARAVVKLDWPAGQPLTLVGLRKIGLEYARANNLPDEFHVTLPDMETCMEIDNLPYVMRPHQYGCDPYSNECGKVERFRFFEPA